MSEVIDLPVITRLKIPVSKVLKAAEGLETAVVVGYTEEGEFYFASSDPDGAAVLWLLKLAERKLFAAADDLADGA